MVIKTVHKYSRIKLLKVLFLIILLAIPYQLGAATQSQNTENWPPIIKQLEAANQQKPNNQDIISSLANAYNNYGLQLADQKQWIEAQNYLKKAIATDPSNTIIKNNLSSVYFNHGYDLFQNETTTNYTSYNHADSKQLANQALSYNPKNTNAYILLGDIEYANQNMDAAQYAWQQAARLVPDNEDVQNRLAKITREANAEASMDTKYNMYFLIKVDPALQKLAGFDINETLDTIRTEVSGDLDYKQNFKIPVIVYTVESFKDSIPDAPDWSEGAFDGKLRIILTQYKNNVSLLKSTMVHEYTHAIISQITKNNIPRWFNEGVAKYMEYKYGIPPRINYLALAYTTNNLIPWDEMNTAIISPNKNEAMLAYQQAFNFVYYLVQRYGMSKLNMLLKTLGTELDFAAAVNQVYQVPLETIQNNWRIWLVEYIPQWAEQPIPTIAD